MIKRVTLFLLILLASLFISCELLLEKPAKPKIHALVIALDYFDSFVSPTDEGNRLNGTIRDAKELISAFTTLSERFNQDITITEMLQAGQNPDIHDPLYPNRANILNKIQELATTLEEHDILFIYYAGHGYDPPPLLGLPGGDLAIAHGTNSADVDIVRQNEISNILKTVQKGHTILVLDSCYSGVYVQDYPDKGLVAPFDETAYNPRFLTVSASRSTETSKEKAIFRTVPYQKFDYSKAFNDPFNHFHGAFSTLFLEALGWDHGDGTDETIDANSVITSVDGHIQENHKIPAFRGGTISISEVFSYITRKLIGQSTVTVLGPLDMILFSDRW